MPPTEKITRWKVVDGCLWTTDGSIDHFVRAVCQLRSNIAHSCCCCCSQFEIEKRGQTYYAILHCHGNDVEYPLESFTPCGGDPDW